MGMASGGHRAVSWLGGGMGKGAERDCPASTASQQMGRHKTAGRAVASWRTVPDMLSSVLQSPEQGAANLRIPSAAHLQRQQHALLQRGQLAIGPPLDANLLDGLQIAQQGDSQLLLTSGSYALRSVTEARARRSERTNPCTELLCAQYVPPLHLSHLLEPGFAKAHVCGGLVLLHVEAALWAEGGGRGEGQELSADPGAALSSIFRL